MNRELLERPFAPAQIKQRRGRNGLLDYVEGHSVIHRLNEALAGAWSFEITHHEIREEEVLVLGKLSAEGVTKMQWGVSQVTREKGSGALVSLGDDLKAAATDAMKKCATFLGVGLHLYADKPLNGRAPAARPASNGVPARATAAPPSVPGANGDRRPTGAPAERDVARPASAGAGNGRPPVQAPPATAATPPEPDRRPGPEPTQANGAARAPSPAAGITERQLDAVVKVALAKGLAPAEIDGISLRAFNRKPAALTRAEGSSLIKELSNLKRRVAT